MIRAYNELYLNDVMRTVAEIFDLAVNKQNEDLFEFSKFYASSFIAKGIEERNPVILSGSSANELISRLFGFPIDGTMIPDRKSKEYYTGRVLAYAQWYSGLSFKKLLTVVPAYKIASLFDTNSKLPDKRTVETLLGGYLSTSKIKDIRNERGLTQAELSQLSGVKLRSIRSYEQGEIAADNIESGTLYAIARTLDCEMTDLLF